MSKSDWIAVPPDRVARGAGDSCSCANPQVFERCRESFDGAYEDWEYRCDGCGRRWWVEGADA